MNRRGYISTALALVTTGSAGCLRLSADETTTATPDGEIDVAPSETATDGTDRVATETATPTPTETATPTETEPVTGTQFVYDGDTLTLDNASGQEVRGTSDLDPGTQLEVALDSESGRDPFVKRKDATVQSDGTFSVTMDLSPQSAGTLFTATVKLDYETLDVAAGRVV